MAKDIEQFGHIGVLMGGYSSEREISLRSGMAVYEALKGQGFHVTFLDIADREEEKIAAFVSAFRLDMAFIALHGHLGEDGTIQTILERLQIPYTGSGPRASRLALNKALAQDIFQKNNIPVPPYVTLSCEEMSQRKSLMDEISFFPVVVKPAQEGSSIGVTLVSGPQTLEEAMRKAWQYGDRILIERYIKGKELTVGILGQEALPVIEIRPQRPFFDFTAKYSAGMTDYIVPATLTGEVSRELQKTALRAHRILGCEDLSRVDFMLAEDNTPYVLEVNTIPGFTATSLLPKAAKAIGTDFDRLCVRLLGLAYGKKKKVKNMA
jgi:D-alanine-D-alanine ligase